MMHKLLAVVALLTTFATVTMGCSSATESSSASSTVSDTTQELTLSQASTDHVRGKFTREGVTILFESIRTAQQEVFVVRSATGQLLISAQKTPDGRVMNVMDGAAAFKGTMTQKTPDQSGDVTGALDKLINSKEGPQMPWLSQALGARGLTGTDYPATFMIHSFGIMMAQAHDIALPALAAPAAAVKTQDYYGGNGAYCQAYSSEWGPQDEGMCGPGATCWNWTCGDCCNHYGCYNHDVACRSCSWRHPGACAACASFSAFFEGGGCDHP